MAMKEMITKVYNYSFQPARKLFPMLLAIEFFILFKVSSSASTTPSHRHVPKPPLESPVRHYLHHAHNDHIPPPAGTTRKQRRDKPPPSARDLQQIIQNSDDEDGDASQRLRHDLLRGYDKGYFPFKSLWKDASTTSGGLRRGLDLQVSLNFHEVHDVDITTSNVDLVVWLRQSWYDPRLTWDPLDYDNITEAWFWVDSGSGPGGETSEVWTPDLELWNLQDSLSDSFVNTHVSVDNTGRVYWSRPGHLRAVCKLEGLSEFPFDELSCTLEFGSWVYSGLYVRPSLMDGTGFTVGGSETAGESYAEYALHSIEAEVKIYPPFPGTPEADWPVLLYHISFHRAWQPYSRGYILLQIVLNLIAFTCFWIPPHIGERMGLSITAMLAAVASELIIEDKLPPAAEITWFAKFSIGSLMFATAALFQSAIVIYFHYHTGDDLAPEYIKICLYGNNYKTEKQRRQSIDAQEQSGTDGGWLVPQPVLDLNEDEEEKYLKRIEESETGNNEDGLSSSSSTDSSTTRRRKQGLGEKTSATTDRTEPSSSDNKIHQGRQQQEAAKQRLSRKLSMLEFQKNLTESTKLGIKTVLGRDADDFKSEREMRNNLRWQKVASGIDAASRVLFPLSFGIFLICAFTVMK